jgi:hypothetical protein
MMSKKVWCSVKNILIVLFVIIIVTAVQQLKSGQSPVKAYKKSCAVNMKTIEGALQLYFVDNKYSDNMVLGVQELKDREFLKSKMTCRVGNKVFDYKTYLTKAPDGKINTDVECPLHGKLSIQETDDKEKGLDIVLSPGEIEKNR